MKFHKSLKLLVENISKLQFSTKHKMTPSPIANDGSTIDVITRTSCNGMYTEEFQEQLTGIIDNILKDTKELMHSLGTYYQKEILEIVIHADRLQHYCFEGKTYKGIEEFIDGFDLTNNEAYQLGALDYGKVEARLEPKEEFYFQIIEHIERLKSELSELLFDEKQEVKPITKLEWYVKPSILAALLEELDTMGWIAPPKFHGETSFKRLAEICNDIFIFNGTESSLRNALSDNKMDREKRNLIALPPLKNIIN